MLEEFDRYISNYDLNDENIRLKYNHSYRVMKLSEKYAKLLNFSENDIKLAGLIGLLHDIGRFEQLRTYGSFYDYKTVDHANYAIEILFDKGLIKKFWNNEEDYEIIKTSIKYHNKIKLPKMKDKRIYKHANLIRDTDKLDIIYLLGYLGELDTKATNDKITGEIYEKIMNHEFAKYDNIKNSNDLIAIHFAYAFDIYNDVCLHEFKNNLYYYYKQVNNERIFKQIYDKINNYIDERIDKNARE